MKRTLWLPMLSISLQIACTAEQGDNSGTAADAARPASSSSTITVEPIRLAVARFQHETCTFCPGGDVTIEDWTKIRPPDTGNAVLTAGSYASGFTLAAREYSGVELIGLTSPAGVFGGSSRAWSTEDTFNHFLDQMIEEL